MYRILDFAMADDSLRFEPQGENIIFTTMRNAFMKEAREYAHHHSLDKAAPTGALMVKDDSVIGRGANGNDYHNTHICERVRRGIPTGQRYDLCEGCHPKNHAEQRAIADALKQKSDPQGADLYLWGHWWFCRWCYEAMSKAGVRKVYLLSNSHKLFNKSHPGNIIGRQFAE